MWQISNSVFYFVTPFLVLYIIAVSFVSVILLLLVVAVLLGCIVYRKHHKSGTIITCIMQY